MRATTKRSDSSTFSSSQCRQIVESSQEAENELPLEFESDAGCAMKKRALGTSSKGKNANKRASKKQSTPTFEAATLKKAAPVPHGKGHDTRQWDDNCAEFDLFGQ